MAGSGDISLIDYIKARLDNIENQIRSLTATVDSVHRQAAATNGRVTEQEKTIAVQEAIKDRDKQWVAARRWWINLVAGCCCIVAGGFVGHFF